MRWVRASRVVPKDATYKYNIRYSPGVVNLARLAAHTRQRVPLLPPIVAARGVSRKTFQLYVDLHYESHRMSSLHIYRTNPGGLTLLEHELMSQ